MTLNTIIYVGKVQLMVYIVKNKIKYVIHKLNLRSHCQLIQIIKQSDEFIIARVQVINCINVKPKSKEVLGFLEEVSKWLRLQHSFLFTVTLPTSICVCALYS